MRAFDLIGRRSNQLERWYRSPLRRTGGRYRIAELVAAPVTRLAPRTPRSALAETIENRGPKGGRAWYRAASGRIGNGPRGTVLFRSRNARATFEAALASAAGYLVGSVPLGLLVSKVAGVDIRRRGTGNIGAANVHENVGRFAAAVVALGVFLQGLVPPLAARSCGGSEGAAAGAAVGAVAGYGWPVFSRFKGGRALGTGTGAAAAISPRGFVVLLASYASGALLKQTSLSALLGFALYAAYVFYATRSVPCRATSLLLLAIIAARRLEGVSRDLERERSVRVVLNLLLFQRRPERPGSEGEKHDG